jgi:hypothetical protein
VAVPTRQPRPVIVGESGSQHTVHRYDSGAVDCRPNPALFPLSRAPGNVCSHLASRRGIFGIQESLLHEQWVLCPRDG